MAKKKSKKIISPKKNNVFKIKYVFLSLTIFIIFGFILLLKIDSATSTPPFNYKFVYSYNGSVYSYDLKTDQNIKLKDENKPINEFAWSKNNKIAYSNEAGELYYIDPETKQSQLLLLENTIGTFFWNKDNSLFAINKIPNYPSSTNDKAFHLITDGTKQKISIEEYENKSKENLVDFISPASFDRRYFSKSSFKDLQETQTFLIDKLKNKQYKMPDGAYKPQLSANNFYVSYKNNASNANGYVYIFRLSDVEAGNFTKPKYIKDLETYGWIDNSKILFVRKDSSAGNLQNYTYSIFDLNTGREKIVYRDLNSPVDVYDIYVSPDKTKIILRKFQETYFSGGELVFVDLNSGKEIKKIPFDQGAWSEPL